jgi:hypothetical protein
LSKVFNKRLSYDKSILSKDNMCCITNILFKIKYKTFTKKWKESTAGLIEKEKEKKRLAFFSRCCIRCNWLAVANSKMKNQNELLF